MRSPARCARACHPLRVVAYDGARPERFEAWRERLDGLLGPVAARIEHVGSTAVPGLPAQPIADVQASVADLDDEDRYRLPCEAAGLQLRFGDLAVRFARSG